MKILTNTTANTSAVSYTLKLKSGGYDFAQYGVGASVSLNGAQVAYRDRYSAPQLSIGTHPSHYPAVRHDYYRAQFGRHKDDSSRRDSRHGKGILYSRAYVHIRPEHDADNNSKGHGTGCFRHGSTTGSGKDNKPVAGLKQFYSYSSVQFRQCKRHDSVRCEKLSELDAAAVTCKSGAGRHIRHGNNYMSHLQWRDAHPVQKRRL